jgi:hypothetical protein
MVKKKRRGSKNKENKIIKEHLSIDDARTEKILIENFVSLQRVITHLSEKFDNLATQISKMLNLFEISAKSLAEREFDKHEDTKEVKMVVDKLEGILEQNKTIAKGLLLLHDEVSPNKNLMLRQETPSFLQKPKPKIIPTQERYPSPPIPTPSFEKYRFTQQSPQSQEKYRSTQQLNTSPEKYQKSISSELEKNNSSKSPNQNFKPFSEEGNE